MKLLLMAAYCSEVCFLLWWIGTTFKGHCFSLILFWLLVFLFVCFFFSQSGHKHIQLKNQPQQHLLVQQRWHFIACKTEARSHIWQPWKPVYLGRFLMYSHILALMWQFGSIIENIHVQTLLSTGRTSCYLHSGNIAFCQIGPECLLICDTVWYCDFPNANLIGACDIYMWRTADVGDPGMTKSQ